jgi:hypothetical protein
VRFRPLGLSFRGTHEQEIPHRLDLSGAFVWICARGVEAKPWLAQGVRFGVAVALLTIVPTYMIYRDRAAG